MSGASAKIEKALGILESVFPLDTWGQRQRSIIEDALYAARAELDEREEIIKALAANAHLVVRDYYSGLPVDREPVDGAMTRLSHLLEDDDGEPLPWPSLENLAALSPGRERGGD